MPGRTSPLDRFFGESNLQRDQDAAVVISERPGLGYLNLRCDEAGRVAASSALKLELPARPNTTASREGLAALWLGPDEWLIVTAPESHSAFEDSLNEALTGMHFAVTDMTGGISTIVLDGQRARDVLAKGCTLDLHSPALGKGACAQSVLAAVGVTIVPAGDPQPYELVVRSSFAEHLARWLLDAGAEYGVGAVGPE